MSSEQASNKSAAVVLTKLRKKALQYITLSMVIKSNDRLAHITSNRTNDYVLFSKCSALRDCVFSVY